MSRIENGLTSRISRFKIATAMALALIATQASNSADIKPTNGDSIDNSNNQPTEHIIGPFPCKEPMPWEPDYKGNDQNQTGEIKLASVKKPEPTPDRYQPECWIVVKDKDNGTIFEN